MFSFFKNKIKEALTKTVEKTVKAVTEKKIDQQTFEDLFWELEIALLENNVALEVIEQIKKTLEKDLVGSSIKRGAIEKKITEELGKAVSEAMAIPIPDIVKEIKKNKPYVIALFGINGVGKTTTLAKLGFWLKKEGFEVVFAAADTFRAAAIEQLQAHGDAIGIPVVKQQYQSDSAAVCYDAIEHARAKKKDVVLIDTAGRNHINKNLMEELKKVIRIAQPNLKVFVGDALTGNDAVEQAKQFDKLVGIDGIILAKQDADEKGGAALSISYATKKPVMFIGTGQNYENLEVFDPKKIIRDAGL